MFYACTALTSIVIPKTITSIGTEAFSGCSKLVEVYNLSSIEITAGSSDNGYVGYYAKNVYTSESGSSYLFTQNEYLFYNDSDVYYLMGYIGSDTILTLPALTVDGVSVNYSIYQYAFYYNKKITSVTINDSVTSIGDRAFYDCTSLTNLTIGKGVTSIATCAFNGCTALTKINFNATAMDDLSDRTNIFSQAGQNSNGITLTIGANVTKIPAYLFYEYSNRNYTANITNIVFEENSVCTSIGKHAFRYCTSLTSIAIPDSVTSIGNFAFKDCTSLTSVYYCGTADEWSAISIGSSNTYLTSATIYYYSESEPDYTDEYNYWHYVEGEIVAWVKTEA